MQLWQFLYALLTDPENRHKELIEWTVNVNEREFRLLEPEAIAVWWGHHKNKANMSYDKLSRSLRYYYDKGIIKKIAGERYVYQFRIDPERMYKHIGNSDSRPKLKPMPQAAKAAMTRYHPEQTSSENSSYVAQPPEALQTQTEAVNVPKGPPPPYPGYSNGFATSIATCSPPVNSGVDYVTSDLSMVQCGALGSSSYPTTEAFSTTQSNAFPTTYGNIQTMNKAFYSQSPLGSPASTNEGYISTYSQNLEDSMALELHGMTSSNQDFIPPTSITYASSGNNSFYNIQVSSSADMPMWNFSQE